MILRTVKIAGFSMLALIGGFFGLSLFFSDLGPGETMLSRFITAGILFFLTGLVTGYFNPHIWMLAGLVGWGGVLLGVSGLIRREEILLSLSMLLISLGPAFLGGFLGSFFSRKVPLKRHPS